MTIIDPLPTVVPTAPLTAGLGVPAAVLRDPVTAARVRAQGVVVHVHHDDDLDLIRQAGVRPAHVVLRCGPVPATIRHAARFGVRRFIAATPGHIETLARCALPTKYVFLDECAPAVFGESRLQIVGLHADVDGPDGLEWGSAAQRLLCRAALMKTCGQPVSRISLAGGPADPAAVIAAVDDAVAEGCARWRLPRPVIMLAPSGR